MDNLPYMVAARVAASDGYFKVGDIVLFGKYKNKKGRIVRLFDDEKGHPCIEVEPVPKGRKQNKIIQLYRIWKAPMDVVKEIQETAALLSGYSKEAASIGVVNSWIYRMEHLLTTRFGPDHPDTSYEDIARMCNLKTAELVEVIHVLLTRK